MSDRWTANDLHAIVTIMRDLLLLSPTPPNQLGIRVRSSDVQREANKRNVLLKRSGAAIANELHRINSACIGVIQNSDAVGAKYFQRYEKYWEYLDKVGIEHAPELRVSFPGESKPHSGAGDPSDGNSSGYFRLVLSREEFFRDWIKRCKFSLKELMNLYDMYARNNNVINLPLEKFILGITLCKQMDENLLTFLSYVNLDRTHTNSILHGKP